MKQFIRKYSGLTITALLFIAVFLFWFHCFPQAMNYQEQNQLFLFSTDYFLQRIALPGGLTDWLSELTVQFYYLSWLGALLLALIAVAIQRLTLLTTKSKLLSANILSLLPVVLLIGVMGDENVLLSYPTAILCALAATACTRRMPWWGDIVAVPMLYWLIGPMTIAYVLIRIIDNPRKEWWTIIWLPVIQLLAYTLFIKEYPLIEVMLGINYYRIPLVLMMPKTLWIVPLAIIVLKFLFSKNKVLENKPILSLVSLAVVIACSTGAVKLGYPKDKYELLMQDYLVRQGKWQEIIDRAEHYQVKTAFSSNAVNLALGMTNQLADRQFTFYQSGEDALIMPMVRDNMSNLPSAEAFYQLGMTNSAKRYMYDIQESIINGRQSGRCMKRIAECLIIDEQYKVAQKYLDVLKQTVFYRQWANDASLDIKNNKGEIGKAQRTRRIKENVLYDYSQIDKMFGQLVVENKDNKLALEYFLGQLLLKGDVKSFMGYLGWVMQQGAYAQVPVGYQDAMRCIQSHGTAPNSAYGSYLKNKLGVRN